MKNSRLFREQNDNQICYIFYIALLWSKDILCRYLFALLSALPLVGIYANFAIDVLFWASFALAFRTIFRRILAKDVLIYVGIIVVFSWSYIFYHNSYEYYVELGQKIASSVLPMFLIGVTLYYERNDRLLNTLYILSFATVICFSLYTIIFGMSEDRFVRGGNMDGAYKLLPHLCLVFCYVVKKPTLPNIAVFALGIFITFSLGTRGAILCLGIHITLTLLFVRNFKHPILFFCCAITFVVLLVYGGIFDLIYNFAEKNGLSLRIFDKFKKGELTSSSGRDTISESIWKFVWVFPIGGGGLFADRISSGGHYAHNLVLEILIDFGIFLGPLLIATIIILLLRAFLSLHKMHDAAGLSLLLTLFASHFVKLFLSGTFLLEGGFFLLMGFCLSIIRTYKRNRFSPLCATPALEANAPEEDALEEVCSV